jgi:hypothetical protein
MTIIGKYCRSYPLSQLRRFPGWTESAENARRIRKEVDGETVEVVRELTDENYVYLHTGFTVTDGIFIDENIIFNNVTPEWIEFCRDVLGLPHNGDAKKPGADHS